MGRQVVLAVLVVVGLVGCAGPEEETTKPKKPNVTAEEAQKNLMNSNAPPQVKKVLGGSIGQGGGDAGKS